MPRGCKLCPAFTDMYSLSLLLCSKQRTSQPPKSHHLIADCSAVSPWSRLSAQSVLALRQQTEHPAHRAATTIAVLSLKVLCQQRIQRAGQIQPVYKGRLLAQPVPMAAPCRCCSCHIVLAKNRQAFEPATMLSVPCLKCWSMHDLSIDSFTLLATIVRRSWAHGHVRSADTAPAVP